MFTRQICLGLNANEIQFPYDKHYKVSSLVRSPQNTHNSVKYGVIWKCQIALPNVNVWSPKQYLRSILDISATRRTLTIMMSRTISRTSETTSKASGPSGLIGSIKLPRQMKVLYFPSRAGPISSSIATMYQPRHHLITIRGQLLFPFKTIYNQRWKHTSILLIMLSCPAS